MSFSFGWIQALLAGQSLPTTDGDATLSLSEGEPSLCTVQGLDEQGNLTERVVPVVRTEQHTIIYLEGDHGQD